MLKSIHGLMDRDSRSSLHTIKTQVIYVDVLPSDMSRVPLPICDQKAQAAEGWVLKAVVLNTCRGAHGSASEGGRLEPARTMQRWKRAEAVPCGMENSWEDASHTLNLLPAA